MSTLSLSLPKKQTFDAIVIGSGASGAWVAKELCERGLKTLVLERGRPVKHVQDYPTASKAPWEFPHLGSVPLEARKGKDAAFMREETYHWAIGEDEQPVVLEKPFRWIRGYHEGGKSLLWARQTQRWSDLDFEGPARDGFAVDWPIRYRDLAPWYDKVERFIGVAGDMDGLLQLPDSLAQKGFELSCIEKHFKQVLQANYEHRQVVAGRCAHLTEPQAIHTQQGRSQCRNQRMCNRGCVYGGYFSSNASTLPWAAKTGKLTVMTHAVVESILYDEKKSRAKGVRFIDATRMESLEVEAKLIFVNASTINSNAILLNSKSHRFPMGLGNDHGLLGKFIAWHNYRGQAGGAHEGFKEFKTEGGNPSNAYLPRFRNLLKQETDFLRGYAVGLGGSRGLMNTNQGLGLELKEQLQSRNYGDWYLSAWMMGETVPTEANHIRLHPEKKDKYGIPQIVFSCDWTDNDDRMVKDFENQMREMFALAGFKNIRTSDSHNPPGQDIHEMGGVRMGKDPKTSLLNGYNQLHACKNVIVSDGACMTSTSTQNPTLTFMALAARAANHAVDELNRKNL